jgi:hypothetical protein
MSPLSFPALVLSEWKETRDTLHKYCRMVGAIREAMSIPLPLSYHTNLLLCDQGLTTSRLPKNTVSPELTFEVILDIKHQRLIIESNFRESMRIALTGQSLNALCDETCSHLVDMGITPPLEKPSFLEGKRGLFKPEPLLNYWRALSSIYQLMSKIKTEFGRDASPVQLRPDDLTLVLTWFGKNINGKSSFEDHQVELGFSTGDDIVPEAYFYISTFPDKYKIEELTTKKSTLLINKAFHKAILHYNDAIMVKDKEKEILEFFRLARTVFGE